LYSKTIGKPGVVAQTCNPSTREAKAGGLILKARGGERRERRRGREREREKEREREREKEKTRRNPLATDLSSVLWFSHLEKKAVAGFLKIKTLNDLYQRPDIVRT
jgi:hypothetical protein